MVKPELIELYKDYHEIIESPIKMIEANSQIIIYEGDFVLQDEENDLTINGSIFFKWLPNSGTYFIGSPISKGIDTFKILNGINSFKVLIDDLEFGKGFVTNTNIESHSGESQIKGVMSQQAVYGDKSISVNKIIFSIPNLRKFHGRSIKKLQKIKFLFLKAA